MTRRFQGGGTLLVAYTNAKLMSNTDTLTSWLEGNTGGVGSVQDWNNLAGERSLSSQDISQRLVISYVLDLPFGHGKAFANNFSGFANGAVSGWGVDGITTFQRGFPLKITWAGASTALESANLGVANVRPDVDSRVRPESWRRQHHHWFNTNCFAAPPQWGFGTEARVDPVLRGPGINNFDFAIFKRTKVTERLGIEFRTEFFNIFNHPYFNISGATGYNGTPTGNGFGRDYEYRGSRCSLTRTVDSVCFEICVLKDLRARKCSWPGDNSFANLRAGQRGQHLFFRALTRPACHILSCHA